MYKEAVELARINIGALQDQASAEQKLSWESMNEVLRAEGASLDDAIRQDEEAVANFSLVQSFVNALPTARVLEEHTVPNCCLAYEMIATETPALQVVLGAVAWMRRRVLHTQGAYRSPVDNRIYFRSFAIYPLYVVGSSSNKSRLLIPPLVGNERQKGLMWHPIGGDEDEFAQGKIFYSWNRKKDKRFFDELDERLLRSVTPDEARQSVDSGRGAFVVRPNDPVVSPHKFNIWWTDRANRLTNSQMANYNVMHRLSQLALRTGKLPLLDTLLADHNATD